MKIRNRHATVALSLAITLPLVSCSPDQTPATGASGLDQIQSQNSATYQIEQLDEDRRPYALVEPVPIDDGNPADADGIAVFEHASGQQYHPVVLARRGINLVESFRVNQDPEYLDLALQHGRKLASVAEFHSDAAYFPYQFDFELRAEELTLRAPWYSAMAQGQALTLFHRLDEYSGDDEFATIIEQTYRSFTMPRADTDDPWVVTRDTDGRIWLEEYPMPSEDHHVLNGHIFALYGLYEHYIETGVGRELLEEAIETVADAIDEFRVRGGSSRYALRFPDQKPTYHFIHIRQLRTLTEMTNDPIFRQWMDILVCDSPPTEDYTRLYCDLGG